jgi:OOP family OmpA-OmpF porin
MARGDGARHTTSRARAPDRICEKEDVMLSVPTLRAVTAVLVCFTLVGVCAAQSGADAPAPAREDPRWYVGAGLGASSAYQLRTEAFFQNLANLGLFFVFIDIVSVDTVDSGYRAFAGYNFNRVVALEVSYEDLGTWSRTGTLRLFPLFPGGEDRETQGTQTEDAWAVGVTTVLHLKKPRWLFFRLGGFFWSTESVTTFEEPEPEVRRSDSGANVLLGLGGDIKLARAVALRLAADHYLNVGEEDQNRMLYTLNVLFRF